MSKKKTTTSFKYEYEREIIDLSTSKLSLKEVGIFDRAQAIEENGSNEIAVKKFKHFKKFFDALTEPFSLLLWVIGIAEIFIYFFADRDIISLISAFLVIFMIFLASIINYVQEHKAYQSNIELHKIIQNKFLVLNEKIEVSKVNFINLKDKLEFVEQSNLTKGDLIFLNKGDIVPSDCRIIWIDDQLQVDQSTLTGEANLIQKSLNNIKTNLLELENILFSQTVISEGNCFAVVIHTGTKNYSSSIINFAEEEDESDFEKAMSKITKILVVSILTMIPIIFIVAGLRTENWITALIFALSIAVALTPEALPAIISSNLKLGAKKMAKNKVVVKKLSVIQNMGSLDVLTTDKTGTLTKDEMEFVKCIDINDSKTKYLDELVCINSKFQKNLNNKIDQAILATFSDMNTSSIELLSDKQFDHLSRVSSILFKKDKIITQVTKGSIAEMLEKITATKEEQLKINNLIKKYADQGFKILIVASANTTKIIYSNLKFEGILLFNEALKEGVKETIKIFKNYKIDLKILTGDDKQNSLNVAKGIQLNPVSLMSGDELSSKPKELIQATNIFYKMSPLDKAYVVKELQNNNHVVGFLGDGVNDAIALKKADVGITVNNATPLAKASSDIILLEKNLDVLEGSFIKGRKIFTNAMKYIKITVAANFGIMLTLLISAFWFEFLVMSPIQLLLQNLIFDFANLVFVLDKVDEIELESPKKWNTNSIIPFAIFNGLVETIISVINFLILGFGFNMFESINTHETLDQFQSAFFIESILTHIILIFSYRTRKISFIQSNPSPIMFYSMLGFAAIPFMFVGIDHTLDNLNFRLMIGDGKEWWFLVLLGLIILAWILCELSKFTYQKIFKTWL